MNNLKIIFNLLNRRVIAAPARLHKVIDGEIIFFLLFLLLFTAATWGGAQ